MIETLLNSGILIVVKIFLLALLFLFIIFSAIVVRQVQLMSKVLTVPISGGFQFIALALLVFAIVIFFIALVLL